MDDFNYSIELKFCEIKQFLSISDENFDLRKLFNVIKNSEEKKDDFLEIILNFIQKFAMFKDIAPFMISVYNYIKKTFEYAPENSRDFEFLLIRTALTGFIQEYINYEKISQKERVLNYLTDSLNKLSLQPLIINLGLLLKPMYHDQKSLDSLKKLEEQEVAYTEDSESTKLIKESIDKWLETQILELNKQDELQEQLIDEYKRLISQFNISIESKTYETLLTEVKEMLALKLTVISLMASISNESFDPVPMK